MPVESAMVDATINKTSGKTASVNLSGYADPAFVGTVVANRYEPGC